MPADDFLGDPSGYEIVVTRLYRDHRGALVSGTVVVASAVSTRPTLAEAVDELRHAIGGPVVPSTAYDDDAPAEWAEADRG